MNNSTVDIELHQYLLGLKIEKDALEQRLKKRFLMGRKEIEGRYLALKTASDLVDEQGVPETLKDFVKFVKTLIDLPIPVAVKDKRRYSYVSQRLDTCEDLIKLYTKKGYSWQVL